MVFCRGEARSFPDSEFSRDVIGRLIHNVNPPHFTDGFAVSPSDDPNAVWFIPDNSGFRALITSRITLDPDHPYVLRIEAPEADITSHEVQHYQHAIHIYLRALAMSDDELRGMMDQFGVV